MASGLAVIAPAAGGIVDQIEHGSTGWLVKPDNPKDLGDAITTLVNQPELRRTLGKAARAAVNTFHSWEYSARAMLNIWEKLQAR